MPPSRGHFNIGDHNFRRPHSPLESVWADLFPLSLSLFSVRICIPILDYGSNRVPFPPNDFQFFAEKSASERNTIKIFNQQKQKARAREKKSASGVISIEKKMTKNVELVFAYFKMWKVKQRKLKCAALMAIEWEIKETKRNTRSRKKIKNKPK